MRVREGERKHITGAFDHTRQNGKKEGRRETLPMGFP